MKTAVALFLAIGIFSDSVLGSKSHDDDRMVNGVSKKRRVGVAELEKHQEVKAKKQNVYVAEEDVELQAGKGSKDTGGSPGGKFWHVFANGVKAGKVFINLIISTDLGEHPSLQIFLNKQSQGKHIGRIAYAKACELSGYDTVYAYTSKSNKASIRAAKAAGFVDGPSGISRQTLLQWNRPKDETGTEVVKKKVVKLPIPDLFIQVPLAALPDDGAARRELLEDYFPEHLPSAQKEKGHWTIRLERPQEFYGSYTHDPSLKEGLEWWEEGTEVHDIPKQMRPIKTGLLAIEDQWMPYSWSKLFKKMKRIPEEVILLHIDDHEDMGSPRLGVGADGKFEDYLTGKAVSLNDPKTVEAAILSGAIGKGSILTPLIWSVGKIHVRHLSHRVSPQSSYKLNKIRAADKLLSSKNNRIAIEIAPVVTAASDYRITNDVDDWLNGLPEGVPILLHIDMDYFNNRFDGNSNWNTEHERVHDLSLNDQLKLIQSIYKAIKQKGLSARIVDTSIGISPGFFPGEFWQPTLEKVFAESKKAGIPLE